LAFFNESCRILGVKQLNTSAYHPQADGAIQRLHCTMCRSISHYINASGSNWDTQIPFNLMANNSCPHGTTNFSPYSMLHGREPIVPTIRWHQEQMSPDIKGTNNETTLKQLHNSLQLAYRLARNNSRKSHSITKN
jgi:hypothetical protein